MLRLITAPAEPVVSLGQAKEHLRIDDTFEDAYLNSLLKGVTQAIDGKDGILGRALVTQTWELTFECFPNIISIPLPPIQSVLSIIYLDVAGDPQTLDASAYQIYPDEPALIKPSSGYSWPDTAELPGAVVVKFIAGYGAAIDVPWPIKRAILERVATAFEYRESSILATAAYRQFEGSADDLLSPYRIRSF